MSSQEPEIRPFNLLDELATFGLSTGLRFNDPQAIPRFSKSVSETLDTALSNQASLHGLRTEAMFEAMLISLGAHRLFKAEDTGRVYPETSFKVPDYRAVLLDGTQWLIEVKNVYIEEPFEQERLILKQAYRQKLEDYATTTGGNLKLAVFWARWSMWTLVSPAGLNGGSGDLTLDLETAMRLNELGALGDRVIGTTPPLRLRLEADPGAPSVLTPDGVPEFTAGGARLYCDENEIQDPEEQQLAWSFIKYGEWHEVGPTAILDGQRLVGIEFIWEPEERTSQGFEMIGTLSRIFSRYYAEQTLDGTEVVQIQAPSRAGWFKSLLSPDYKGKAMPLWRFQQQPST